MKKLLLLAAVCVVLPACATIVHGRRQTVNVSTVPVSDADCTLTNNKGSWHVKHTPGKAKIHRSNKPLKVVCKREGYPTATRVVRSKASGATFGNIIMPGGLIGAGVDAGNGSMFAYPKDIMVKLK